MVADNEVISAWNGEISPSLWASDRLSIIETP